MLALDDFWRRQERKQIIRRQVGARGAQQRGSAMNIQADYFPVIHRLSSGVRDYRQVSYSGAVKKFTGSGCQPAPLPTNWGFNQPSGTRLIYRDLISRQCGLWPTPVVRHYRGNRSNGAAKINERREDSFDFYRGTKKGGRYAARRIGTVSMLNSEARGTRCTRDVSKVETKVSLGSEETLLPFELARRE